MDKGAVICMTIGLVFFTLADTELNPNFEIYGVILVCSALIADAIIGNVQEKAMNKSGSSNVEMVLYSYSIGFVYILLWEILISQRLLKAIEFCSHVIEDSLLYIVYLEVCLFFINLKHTQKTYGYIFIYSFFGYFGVNAVLTLVKQFGALLAVTGKFRLTI